MAAFTNPSPERMRELLKQARRIAVVGCSPDPDRPSHAVARYLQSRGWEIVPVNPGRESLLGVRCYPTLAAVPDRVDVVDVFRSPGHVAGVVDEFLERDDPALWLQEGVIDEASALRAQAAGREVVMDRCTAKVAAGI